MGITTNEFVDLLWAFVLIAINGYFVAAEFAIVRSRRTRIEQYVQQGSKIAKHAMDVISKIDAYLSATQLGITLASLGLGWTAQRSITPLLIAVFGQIHGVSPRVLGFVAAVIAFLLVTFLQIVFGELAPKSLAISRAETWLMASALPLKAFYKLMYPAIWLLNATARNVLRMAHITSTTSELAHSEEELRMLVTQSHESGVIDETERELFNNVFAFADRVAREIMVPRTDMVTLFTDQTIEECLEEIQRERHTRFPLCEDDKDHVVGIIHSKDLFSFALQHPDREGSIRSLARKVVTVPEAMGIDDVLKVLQKERSSLAIVIDEYGGTAGMVSLEDVIEELVGEIQDEFDEERPPIEERDGYLSVDARMLIEEVNELFGFSLSDEEVDTVGGWVYAQLVGPLKVGLEVEYEGARFVVAEIDNLRITRLHVYPPEVADEESEAEDEKKGQEE
ncbi:hemolysin family protein [Sulfoacidibacillus thermotolerans]|uniref:hemolysin family protein n=1 Tax=Sulfoacidibacillus thermotolerans TaxID=1765684 RepID=UPI001FE7BD86|nr:hemolysin family protein [Sulfoacidibacillus thermotolerans]